MKKSSFIEGIKNPNSYVIILTIIIISMVLTWLVPSGSFDRVEDPASGRTVIDPDSFKYIEDTSVGIFDALKTIPKGISGSGGIISFIFIISGAVEVIRSTGALDSAILYLVDKMKGKDTLLLIFISFLFTMLGAVFGFAEETIPFIPLGISMCLALGYDRMVGFHVVRTAAWIGFAGAFLNPFSIGVAQSIAELPMFSGIGYRLICYLVFFVIGMWYILSYAKKVKDDPTNSVLYGYESQREHGDFELRGAGKLTANHKMVLLVSGGSLLLLVYGVIKYGWYTVELSALFLGVGILAGFVGGFTPNKIASEFTKGMRGVTSGALVVGFARAIVLILEEGMILDTLIFFFSQPLLYLGSSVAAVGMFIVQSILNFFIGSSSGLAAATMPIMIPLSDVLGVTRQTAVLAFQFGDGITNMLWPSMIYYLTFADIPYNVWFKHILKLNVILSIAAIILVAIAQMINYGPF